MGARTRAVDAARAIFALDVRSLALFRIGLGLVVVLDAAFRLRDVPMFYTDAGILKRADFWGTLTSRPSLYNLDGSEAFATALLCATLLAGAALLVGWRTRTAAVLAWLLTLSVQHRNGYVNTGADSVETLMLTLAIFLPVGARFSIDALRRPHRATADDVVFHPATAALVVQIVVIYLFNVLNKNTGRWWDGNAALIALHVDGHATTFGVWLREHARFLAKPLTWGTIVAESSALLLLVPWRPTALRFIAFAMLVGLHLGFAATMYLGLFPWVCIVAWLAVLPAAAWERGPLAHLDARARRVLPPASGPPSRLAWPAAIVAVAVVTVQLWSNVAHTAGAPRLPPSLSRAAAALRIHATWAMFDSPGVNDGWYVIPGTLASGREVDLFRGLEGRGREVSFAKPRLVSETYSTARWRKLMMSMSSPKKPHGMRKPFARWLCRTWNATHAGEDALVSLRFVYVLEKTRKNATVAKPEQVVLLEHTCDR